MLVSAYLIPTPALEEAVEKAEKRGVEVHILTNSLRSNNHIAAHSAYRHHLRRLVHHGADLHEVRSTVPTTCWSPLMKRNWGCMQN